MASGRPKSLPEENTFQSTAADIGLTHKDIFDARQIRDAEDAPELRLSAVRFPRLYGNL